MPLGLTNLEWRNLNEGRRYPLADSAGGSDLTGLFLLPNSFLVAIDLPVHAAMTVDPARFFLYKLGVYGTGYSVTIGYSPSSGGPTVPVASALIDKQTLTPGRTYALSGIEPFDDTSGKLTIGKTDDIDFQPSGYFEFSFNEGQLDPDTVRPLLQSMISFTVVNGQQESARIYGDAVFTDGIGTQWVATQIAGQPTLLQLNASTDLNFAEDCVCSGDVTQATPIRFINDIPGDNEGNYNLLGTACVTLTPATNGLIIRNPCTEPCATCSDLEAITADLQRLLAQAAIVEGFGSVLQANNAVFQSTVLGARLSDRGCVTGGG